jgi:hypothetical protein
MHIYEVTRCQDRQIIDPIRLPAGPQNKGEGLHALCVQAGSSFSYLRKPHNLGMLLEFPEDLLAQGIGDLGVDAGVLDVLVT